MKIADVNRNLIGKRVRITDGPYKGEGRIAAIIECKRLNRSKKIAAGEPKYIIFRTGVKVVLDKPVLKTTGYGAQQSEWWEDEAYMLARVGDEFGDLKYVELI